MSLSETLEQNEETRLSEDPDELIGDKEKRKSLEDKIDFIKTKLLFYEEKFKPFVKELVWTVIFVAAILYGWKLLAGLF